MQQAEMAFLQLLEGEWVAEDDGQATGGFTFLADLLNTIYIRRNHATYAATKETPTYAHEDLMVVYYDAQIHKVRAWYTDNEGHVIEYFVHPIGNEQTVEFISASNPGSPRYRLRYTPITPDSLRISFAIAPPDQLEQFAHYIEARVRRVLPAT